ncbi:DUF2947 domain-containing protein [Vibrio sp. SS-MA-C1-2]|uniref:DUF2947 domain-containing protein n=1 Tax=Vibrio sp. SS-MA-C1-2 TaxID=2908646 RepID=UPI001F205D20|nr:DUF2947 domain-containing protein [Vibrio sp. SS-MA-C1-2]UJF16909.1 DUF2947 domain-containing protein [Vibrio sp. SS-MA-C1-2]
MSYQNLDEYSKKWIFTHPSMPVSEQDYALIKPMTQARSMQLWKDFISAQSPDPEHFERGDWPVNQSLWQPETVDWQTTWEADGTDLPTEISEYIDWQDQVTIYFCYEKYNVIETTWGVFKRTWKNFLFFDDGPILIGKKRKQALWFAQDGTVKLGERG